ncbi:MAG: hypothetical protein ABEJ99_04010 [Candidatus Nanohaloarchaea archaeon]
MDKLVHPATVQTFEEKTCIEKKFWFLENETTFEEETESVKISDDENSYGRMENSTFRILPGEYTFETEIEEGKNRKKLKLRASIA